MLSTDKQTDKLTNDKLTNATKNITSFAKEVKTALKIYGVKFSNFRSFFYDFCVFMLFPCCEILWCETYISFFLFFKSMKYLLCSVLRTNKT